MSGAYPELRGEEYTEDDLHEEALEISRAEKRRLDVECVKKDALREELDQLHSRALETGDEYHSLTHEYNHKAAALLERLRIYQKQEQAIFERHEELGLGRATELNSVVSVILASVREPQPTGPVIFGWGEGPSQQ